MTGQNKKAGRPPVAGTPQHITVKAHPFSKKEKLIKLSEGSYEIFVKEPAQNNLANKRILFLLSLELGLGARKLRIVAGHKSSKKRIQILD